MSTLEEFVVENREMLIAHIHRQVPNAQYFDSDELELWVCNDEGLYTMALSEGVEDI